MNLAQLRALTAVVDHGGFSRAATELGISQPAVSHAVGALEREIGQRLLDRGRLAVTLTPIGRVIIEHARAATRAVEKLEAAASMAGAELAGELRIGGMASTNLAVLPSLARRFRRRHPRAGLCVFEGSDEEVVDWVDQGVVDIGCVVDGVGRVDGPVLATDEFVAIMNEDHPLADQPHLTLADLADDPFIATTSGCDPIVRLAHRQAGLLFRPAHRVGQVTTLLTMVRAGLGVSMIPSLLLSPAGPSDGLVAVPLLPSISRTVRIGSRVGVPKHPAAEAFLQMVEEQGPVTANRQGDRVAETADLALTS